MNLLILCYYFPPRKEVGGKRFHFLSEEFMARGHNVTVLTTPSTGEDDLSCASRARTHRVKPLYAPPVSRYTDESLPSRLFIHLWIHYLCCLAPESAWIPPAVLRGLRLAQAERFDAIITTGPPFSPHVAGYAISKLTGIPLVVDYRDPWTGLPTRSYPRLMGRTINRALESRILSHARHVVVNTEFMRAMFDEKAVPPPAKLSVISNGFHSGRTAAGSAESHGMVRMVYAGNFYRSRRPGILLQPIRQLLDEGIIAEGGFEFVILSDSLTRHDQDLIRELRLDTIVRTRKTLPHKELLQRLTESDILVIISGNEHAYAVPYKFYDYLSVRRPMLAIAPRDSQMQAMMRAIDCGVFADIDSSESIKAGICQLLASRGSPFSYLGAERLQWGSLADEYLQVLRGVIEADGQLALG